MGVGELDPEHGNVNDCADNEVLRRHSVYLYYPDTNTWILDGVVAPAPSNEQAQRNAPTSQDGDTGRD